MEQQDTAGTPGIGAPLTARLVDALENLSDAAQGLIQTITYTPGRTPEDEDRHGHEKWAADDLAAAVSDARAPLNTVAGSGA
jgi:hypothetical protein